jgi:hypothetical protein
MRHVEGGVNMSESLRNMMESNLIQVQSMKGMSNNGCGFTFAMNMYSKLDIIRLFGGCHYCFLYQVTT